MIEPYQERYERIRETIESDTGTFRIIWVPVKRKKDAPETNAGAWAYTDKDEAESDAKRFAKMPFCKKAWVEEREPKIGSQARR